MVLSITVSSVRINEIPSVLNYLTAPNVLIRSAACASATMIGLYSTVDLLAKDSDGRIIVWSPSSGWTTTTSHKESPEQRLAELFNVNHFILSQSQPYIVPFLAQGPKGSKSILSRIFAFTGSEIRFRITQLTRLKLVPLALASIFEERLQGNITINPPLSTNDFTTIFGNPTSQSLSYWILKGEQSTWPHLHMIKCRTMVEQALNSVKMEQGVMKEGRRNSVDARAKLILKKRTQSIG
jgi:TAG lipase/lysophosphatidylethanolamine acyltransferase